MRCQRLAVTCAFVFGLFCVSALSQQWGREYREERYEFFVEQSTADDVAAYSLEEIDMLQGRSWYADTPLYSEQYGLIGYPYQLEPAGFVVVSADRQFPPVLCFSDTSYLDSAEDAENALLDLLIRDCDYRYDALIDGVAPDAETNEALWSRVLLTADTDEAYVQYASMGTLASQFDFTMRWGPILTSSWGQDAPYNSRCPYDSHYGSPARCKVGCVAVAVGQIVYYWKTPSRLTFPNESHQYSCCEDVSPRRYDQIQKTSASFSFLTYDNSSASIATIAFAAGISARMRYSSELSLAWLSHAAEGLRQYWGYNARHISPYTVWNSADLQEDLTQGRPVILGFDRWSDELGGWFDCGHAVVCDGVRVNPTGIGTHYHIRMGDNGNNDNWYALPTQFPDGYNAIKEAILTITPGE